MTSITQTIKAHAAHYIECLLASSWNAGIRAIKINGGITIAAAAAPTVLPMPNLGQMLMVFGAAAAWEAIDFLNDHPLPTDTPTT